MAMRDIRKRKLSKAVLEMKFMKQTKDKQDFQKELEESSTLYSDQITEGMKSGGNIIIERSVARCKGLPDGRLSFQGMNPEIERLMEIRLNTKGVKRKLGENQNADITDVEMANYNLQVNETVAKRFMTKAERQTKKLRFMKPDDD